MKTYGGVEVQLNTLLTWLLEGGEFSASRPCRITLGVRAPSGRWIESWVGLKTLRF